MKLFKRKLKITQIAVGVTDQWFYTVGLGNDGKCYLWDKVQNGWVEHIAPKQPVMPEDQEQLKI